MDYFKIKTVNKKKTEEEIKSSLEEYAAKEHPDYIITDWMWDEELHEGIIQMQSK